MIELAEAIIRLEAAVGGLKPVVETIPIGESSGRVLAADAVSRIDIPPFDRVMMDGYAIPPGPQSRVYRVSGFVPAGSQNAPALEPGTAMKVMTGAEAPAGTGRIVMVEHTRERDGWVEILDESPTVHVAPRGEDVGAGEVVLKAGSRIGPTRLAGLTSCGLARVEVFRPPRATFLATGDELVPAGGELAPGLIHDANTPLMANLLRERGYEVATPDSATDDPPELREAVGSALDAGGLTVITGGVSMGDRDIVPGVLKELGLEIIFDRVKVKPGKPATLAAGPRGIVLALPGNPVSAFVGCFLYVLPALSLMEGRRTRPRFIPMPLAAALAGGADQRLRLLPARLDEEGRVDLLDYHNSGHVHALLRAEGLVRVEAGAEPPAAGESVPFWPLRCAAYVGEEEDEF